MLVRESDTEPVIRDGPSQAGFARCFGRSMAALEHIAAST